MKELSEERRQSKRIKREKETKKKDKRIQRKEREKASGQQSYYSLKLRGQKQWVKRVWKSNE